MRPPHLFTTGIIKPCCANPANLEPWQQAPPGIADEVRRCRRCQCRHFRMFAEPGVIGITGKPLGFRRQPITSMRLVIG